MRWFADNSELNGIKEASIPDILLFGGIAVAPENEKLLQAAIEHVKGKYGHPRAPIKWNFKDLKKTYSVQQKDKLYDDLIKTSKDWRTEIFDSVKDIEFTIIIACIESNSAKTKIIKNIKEELTRYVFNNGLMRYALHAKDTKPVRAEVILDWPDRKDSKPFDIEYATAYAQGKTYDHGQEYLSGTLESLNFLDTPVFANMHHSTLLQFADLIVGATREFVECALGKKETGFGIDMLQKVKHRFRGAPHKIYGRGISVASNKKTFRDSIEQGIKDHL